MTLPNEILHLIRAETPAMDAAEVAEITSRAAELVDNFVHQEAGLTLDKLLGLAAEPTENDLEMAQTLAADATQQTQVLETEVARFLSLSRKD